MANALHRVSTHQQLADVCRALEARFAEIRAAGIAINPASRFPTYIKIVEDVLAAGQFRSGRPVIDLGQAVAECSELNEILRRIHVPKDLPGWERRLKLSLEGAVSPHRPNDRARAAQFEMLAMARCLAAGAKPAAQEPDMAVRIGIRTLLIAAKRLRSLAALERNVREARQQIVDSAHSTNAIGMIALDLTAALGNDSYVRLVGAGRPPPDFGQRTTRRLSQIARRVGEWIRADPAGRVVHVVSSYCRTVAFDTDTGETITHMHWLAGPTRGGAPIAARLKRFVMRFGGAPNPG